ncbi:MAG: discoidin domain-containing protein [Bacteroidales bacterium]|nr:discoidin domain-containing protein [Bacteroidales bacterium]
MQLKNLFVSIVLSVFMTLSAFAQDITTNFINHKGQDLFLSGINVAWINYGNDLTGFDKQKWTTLCEEVSEAGGNSLRWWIHVDGRSTPTYDPTTLLVTGMPESALNNLELALDIAAEHGLVVSLCLWAHGMLAYTDSGDQSSAVGNARRAKNKKILTEEEGTMAYINNALIPMVNKVKNHTAILCWEIFNEPEGMTNVANWSEYEHIDISYIQKFVNLCAGAIHRADPNAKVSNGSWAAPALIGNKDGNNYYTNEKLIAQGGDEDGYLDFYMFHYYPTNHGKAYSPFHQTFEYFEGYGVDKKLIIGEFPARGILKSAGWLLPNTAQKTTEQAMLWLYQNGYSGGWGWTYSNHDGNGGLDDMKDAMAKLKTMYPEHIIIQHDKNFNYIPHAKGKIPDTAVFTNSAKISKYVNVNDFFEDDENDVLTFTFTADDQILSVELDEDGYISFSPVATTSQCGTITITATDKGGKQASTSFFVLVRNDDFSSDNKLLNAFVTYSSMEDEEYLPFYANDGDESTRWSSLYNDDEFIMFDMFQEETIQRIVLNWEWTGEKGAYAQAYSIAVSNDKQTWDTVFSVKKGQSIQSNIILNNPVTCRYLKITFTERATIWGYSLTEVEAYTEINENHNVQAAAKTQLYQACYANEPFSYQKNLRTLFKDADNDVLTISAADNKPNWLQFDPELLTLTGTPQLSDTGVVIFNIIAKDYAQTSASREFKIKVLPPDNVSISTIENPVVIYPNPCVIDSFTITISNIEGKALASFTNADGKLAAIKYITFQNGQATCLTDGLTQGVYGITIRVNGETYKSKVVIQ